jgi:hypothetical protein
VLVTILSGHLFVSIIGDRGFGTNRFGSSYSNN